MPKLTDEKKWDSRWFRSLPMEFKCAWLYLLDKADLAGVVDLDRELANYQIRGDVDWDRFIHEAGNRVRVLASGKLWIPKVVKFQAGDLSSASRYVKGVKRQLQRHGLLEAYLDEFPPTCVETGLTLSKPLAKGYVRVSKPCEGEGEGEGSIRFLEKTSDVREDSEQKSLPASNSRVSNSRIVSETAPPPAHHALSGPDPFAPPSDWSALEKSWWASWLATWRAKNRGQELDPMLVASWRTKLQGQPGHVAAILEFSCEKNSGRLEVSWYLGTLARGSSPGKPVDDRPWSEQFQEKLAKAMESKGGAA